MKFFKWVNENRLLSTIIVFFVLLFILNNIPLQKEAGWSDYILRARTGSVALPLASTAAVGAAAWYLSPWILIPAAVLFLGPSIISSWTSLFSYQTGSSLPSWIWIVLVFVLIFMLLKKK